MTSFKMLCGMGRFCKYSSRYFKSYISLLFAFSLNATAQEIQWIPGWQSTSDMQIARAGAAIVSHNNKIYVIGGVDGVNFLSSVEVATVTTDGALSPWKNVRSMPEARGFVSAVVFNNRIYVVGGANGRYGKKLLNSVVSAAILESGELGRWRTENETLLTPRRCSKIFVNDNTLYALGGFGGALLDTVESSRFGVSGKLTPWKMQANHLVMPRYVNEVKRVGDLVLAIGGHHPSQGIGIKDVEMADLSAKVLSWKSVAPMQVGRYAFSSAVYKNRVYAFGGISGAEYLNSTEKLPVDNKIVSKKWSKSTNLPAFMANFTTMVVGDRIYVFGGSTRHEYLRKVWYASFNSTGDIGYYGTKDALDAFKLKVQTAKKVTKLPNSGTVLESIATNAYTYIRVLSKDKEIWLAAPITEISIGKKIQFSEGVYMSNFYSKALKRNFAAILFVGTVSVE